MTRDSSPSGPAARVRRRVRPVVGQVRARLAQVPALRRTRQQALDVVARVRPEVLHVYAMDVDAADRVEVPNGVDLVPATAESLAALHDARPGFRRRKHDIMLGRVDIAAEHPYLIVDVDGIVAGYCHMATTDNRNERINHLLRVDQDSVYLYDDFVFGDRRRRGLHAASIAGRLRLAAERGRRRALTTISDPNTASIASYAAFGATPIRRLVHIPDLGRTVSLPTWSMLRPDRRPLPPSRD